MVTITETVATPAQLLADIGAMLDSLGSWTREHSGAIKNDGQDANGNDSGSWQDNGLLYSNSDAGIYLLMTLQTAWIDNDGHDGRTTAKGVRFHVSTDWDADLMHPAGMTDTTTRDPWSGDVGFGRDASFDDKNFQHSHNADGQTHEFGGGVYWRDGSPGTFAFRSESVTYFMSAGNDYINVASWSPSDGNNGSAGYVAWEHTNQKFWDDGGVPYTMWTVTNAGAGGNYGSGNIAQYGFNHIHADYNNQQFPYQGVSGFDSASWGVVNPDSADDTFFFKRPVIYQSHQKRVPVGYVYNALANDRDEGGAHGDEVTHENQNFRVFRQTGMSEGTPVSAALRYE